MSGVELLNLGDQGILVRFGSKIDPAIHHRVRRLMLALSAEPCPGVVELVPSYAALAVYYDPLRVEPAALRRALKERLSRMDRLPLPPPRRIEIPVCYGGSFGPDLADVAAYHGMSQEEVIRLHSEPEYLVYMLGFSPGFPYLGGLPPQLATPRRSTPRLRVPAGSVGIAGAQTGIYPSESPGGWQLIGRTPLRLYDPQTSEPFLLRAGDVLRFRPIDEDQFRALAGD